MAAGRIDSTVAVFVENPPQTRNDELFGNPIYADFLATELLPRIRTNLNVTEDSSRVVVAGASAGGVGATYAALRHSSVFGNVLSQSGGFGLSPER
jgi:enterochelin esterase family protein